MPGEPSHILAEGYYKWLADGGKTKISKRMEKKILEAFITALSTFVYPNIPLAIAEIMKTAIKYAITNKIKKGELIETLLRNIKLFAQATGNEEAMNKEIRLFMEKFGFISFLDIWERL